MDRSDGIAASSGVSDDGKSWNLLLKSVTLARAYVVAGDKEGRYDLSVCPETQTNGEVPPPSRTDRSQFVIPL